MTDGIVYLQKRAIVTAVLQPVVILLVKGLAVCRGLDTSAGCFPGASLGNSFLIDPELSGGLMFPVGRLSKWKMMGYWMTRVTSV